MNISIFDVVGPVMIGPSSSHTAGAARLARFAALAVADPFSHVDFGLHGSFAKTGKGHGTDRALVAGALGMGEDDEDLVNAFEIARERGLTWSFSIVDLEGHHENSVKMTFSLDDGRKTAVTGSSIGGGRIVIHTIGDFTVDYTAESSALILRQMDRKGIISDTSRVLAARNINIGVMRLSRSAKGGEACCVIETDGDIPEEVLEEVRQLPHILAAQAINISGEVQ